MPQRKGPNLQNIPIRTPGGRRIRDAFVQTPTFRLEMDYAELEKRIMEHYKDEVPYGNFPEEGEG